MAYGDNDELCGGYWYHPTNVAISAYGWNASLPAGYFVFLILAVAGYMILTQSLKGIYVRKFGWQ